MKKIHTWEVTSMNEREVYEANENLLICGDNLEVMGKLYEGYGSFIDLIYIDPPYCSDADYNSESNKAYSDKWENGLQSYLPWMTERLAMMHRLLKENGSLFVQVDWRASHYLKVELDKIFGTDAFRCEIIWRRGKGVTRTAGKQLPRNHDSILWYSKSDTFYYKRLFKEYNPKTLKMYRHDDGDGRGKYRTQELRTYSQESIKKFELDSRIFVSSTGRKYLKQYLTDKPGVSLDTVWEDIGGLAHGSASESVGFQTQKPEALISRILSMAADQNYIVADFFCGSGTTCVTAQKHGLKWIGVDQNPHSVEVTADRLKRINL